MWQFLIRQPGRSMCPAPVPRPRSRIARAVTAGAIRAAPLDTCTVVRATTHRCRENMLGGLLLRRSSGKTQDDVGGESMRLPPTGTSEGSIASRCVAFRWELRL